MLRTVLALAALLAVQAVPVAKKEHKLDSDAHAANMKKREEHRARMVTMQKRASTHKNGVSKKNDILPDCMANSATWDAGYGACDTYDDYNAYWCPYDMSEGFFAEQVCPECGKCQKAAVPPSPPAPPPPPLPACKANSMTWNAGYGPCDTYDDYNEYWCPYDFSEGFYAEDVCPECGKCDAAPY